jgi:tetratricopeptide (TPR) repeat protein
MLRSLLVFLLQRPWLALRSRRARALLTRGLARRKSGDLDGARADLERALKAGDAAPATWLALGDVRLEQGDPAAAAVCFRSALAAAPDSPEACLKLGSVLRGAGSLDEALAVLRRAYELAPQAPGTLRALFDVLLQVDNYGKARVLAENAAARDPASYEARLLLGRALQKLNEPERALECYETARRMRADDAELYDMRGSTYQELGRLEEAFADYERALALRPHFPLAAFHRAMARLLTQDFERGWEDYELRLLEAGEHATLPRWDGAEPRGKTILVGREQGLGDEIMFASILPELLRAGGHWIVECDPRLRALFSRSFPGAMFFGSVGGGLPLRIARERIDAQIPAGSLPRLRRESIADFPRHAGYLQADARLAAQWRDRLTQLGGGLKVGIAWTGGVRRTRREMRSIALEQLLPVLRTPGARFVSLEYVAGAADELGKLETRHGVRIEHWREAIDDYDETAALVQSLDLVVSVCTSVVHLGGALGRPVWVMAPYSPEWRYGFSGEAMPWYPSVRLFRQPAYGRWDPVIAAVARELAALAPA